jgi:DNA ligase-1
MAPNQASLGKFFGAKGQAPQQQTKLSFATKAATKKDDAADEGAEDVVMDDGDTKENADPQKGEL